MAKFHRIEGIVDPKYGNWCRITVEGEDLEKVLESFSRQARLISSHTEDELRELVKKDQSIFTCTVV